MNELEVRVGRFPVAYRGEPAHRRGEVLDGAADAATVTGPNGLNISIGCVTWPDGVRDARTIEVIRAPETMVYEAGRTTLVPRRWNDEILEFMDLEALSIRPKKSYPAAVRVTEDQLDWILGSSAFDLLKANGLRVIGKRCELFGDTGAVMNRLTVGFEPGNSHLPLIAYALTRQLAMYRRFDRDEQGGIL